MLNWKIASTISFIHKMIHYFVWQCWDKKIKRVKSIFFPLEFFFLEETYSLASQLYFTDHLHSLFFVIYSPLLDYLLSHPASIFLIKLLLKYLQVVWEFVEERLIAYFLHYRPFQEIFKMCVAKCMHKQG